MSDERQQEQPAATPAAPAEWAVVEIMGHRRHVGMIAEEHRFGAVMLRIDVPARDGSLAETRWYGGSAIFGMQLVSEATARALLEEGWAYEERRAQALAARPSPPDTRYLEYADPGEVDF